MCVYISAFKSALSVNISSSIFSPSSFVHALVTAGMLLSVH